FKLNVQAKANELANSTDSEKRTKIVEEIGLTLSNASIESEKRGKEIRWERVHDGTAETSGEAGKKPGEAQWERAQNDDYTVVSDKSNQAATTSPREINRKVEIGEKGLNYDQVSRFLDDKLHELYTKVKKAGALTEDNITQYLGAFAESVQPLVVKIPSGQRDQIVEEFRVSTDEILQNISDNGQLSPEKVKSYKNEIH
ncbi:MAG: hypothetical protein GY866_17375, partial [Proteobacteria bacterium]|nr:hypothetical protein [Pseudomonadota bacterium]